MSIHIVLKIDIYNVKITFKKVDEDQSSLLVKIMDFKKKTRQQNPEKKQEKKDILKTYMHFLRVKKEFLMLLKAKYF